MQKNLSNKELVAAGHQFAKNLSSDTPLIDMAKMVSQLATQLDVALVAAGETCKQRDAVLAENVVSRKAVQTFCDVVGGNTHAICEEVGADGVRAILAAMNATGNMPATDAMLNAVRAEGAASVGTLIRACADDFPDSAEYIVEECATIADYKAAQLRAETDTTSSQYESLAGGK